MNAIAKATSGAVLIALALTLAAGAAEPPEPQPPADLEKLVGQPADLSPWAYAWRADREVQEKPEAYFIPRRLERLERIWRQAEKIQTGPDQWPLCLPSAVYQGEPEKPTNPKDPWRLQKVTGEWVSGAGVWASEDYRKEGRMIPSPKGDLHAAVLWETIVPWTSIELRWPKDGGAVPPPESVETRFYPSRFGWFAVVWDRKLSRPQVSADGLTWTYRAEDVADLPKGSFAGTRTGLQTDMVAVFVDGKAAPAGAKWAVPTIHLISPIRWKRADVAIEWGFQAGTEKLAYDGRIEGFMGIVGRVAPLDGAAGTTMTGPHAWQSPAAGASRRGVVASLLYLDVDTLLWREPYDADPPGRDRPMSHLHSRITVWTKTGNFTFLPSDAKAEPILAPEYGFFVSRADAGKTGREYAQELAARGKQSILERTRQRPEATAEQAIREIKKPCLDVGVEPPPFAAVEDPPMQVQLPEQWWNDVWRMVASQEKKPQGWLSCGSEAAHILRPLNLIGYPDVLLKHTAYRLQSPGMMAEADFLDGDGSLHDGQRHDWVSAAGTTGMHLFNLAEHYLVTRDQAWLQANRRRLQQAADWLIRQRREYMKDVPNRDALWCAGLQPPAASSESWGKHQYRWWYFSDAASCEALFAFARALEDVDAELAAKYAAEARQYSEDIRRSVERSIAVTPVRRLRSGVYRSYSPGVCYARGPFVTFQGGSGYGCEDWLHQDTLIRSLGWDSADVRLAGSLEVLEDAYLFRTSSQALAKKRQARGLAAEDDWFWGGFGRAAGWLPITDAHLAHDDVPAFLRSWINCSTLHTNWGKEGYWVVEGSDNCLKNTGVANNNAGGWLTRNFRNLLVMEIGDALWMAKATPRHWLEQGKKIAVKNAPTYFGPVGYEIVSDADNGRINATVEMPSRNPPKEVILRFRHPKAAPIKGVTVNGKPWTEFDKAKETILLKGLTGTVTVTAQY
jgi:hypothetical protein